MPVVLGHSLVQTIPDKNLTGVGARKQQCCLKNTQADLTHDQWTHTKNISLVWTLVRLYNKPDQSRQGFALESNNVLALSSSLVLIWSLPKLINLSGDL